MKDQEVAQHRPLRPREECHQILLDGKGGRAFRQAETMTQSRDMGIHHDAHVDPEGISQDDIRSLPGYASK